MSVLNYNKVSKLALASIAIGFAAGAGGCSVGVGTNDDTSAANGSKANNTALASSVSLKLFAGSNLNGTPAYDDSKATSPTISVVNGSYTAKISGSNVPDGAKAHLVLTPIGQAANTVSTIDVPNITVGGTAALTLKPAIYSVKLTLETGSGGSLKILNTRSYQARSKCSASPFDTIAPKSSTAATPPYVSVVHNMPNTYSYNVGGAVADAISIKNNAGGDGTYAFACEIDLTGTGGTTAFIEDCTTATSFTQVTNYVAKSTDTRRHVGVTVLDAECGGSFVQYANDAAVDYTVGDPLVRTADVPFGWKAAANSIPATAPETQFLWGQLISGAGPLWTGPAADPRVANVNYLTNGPSNEGSGHISITAGGGDPRSLTTFSITSSTQYNLAAGQSSENFGLALNLSFQSFDLTSVTAGTAFVPVNPSASISYKTDGTAEKPALSFSASGCTVSELRAQPEQATVVDCTTQCTVGGAGVTIVRQTVEFWGEYSCNVSDGAGTTFKIQGTFDAKPGLQGGACPCGGQGQGQGTPSVSVSG